MRRPARKTGCCPPACCPALAIAVRGNGVSTRKGKAPLAPASAGYGLKVVTAACADPDCRRRARNERQRWQTEAVPLPAPPSPGSTAPAAPVGDLPLLSTPAANTDVALRAGFGGGGWCCVERRRRCPGSGASVAGAEPRAQDQPTPVPASTGWLLRVGVHSVFCNLLRDKSFHTPI